MPCAAANVMSPARVLEVVPGSMTCRGWPRGGDSSAEANSRACEGSTEARHDQADIT
jgi:hypothetical protein